MEFLQNIEWASVFLKIGKLAVLIVVGLIAIKLILKVLRKIMERSQLDEALYTFINNTAKILLWIVLVVTVLGYLNVSVAALVTVIGAAGAAVALALKDSLSNFAGGILILLNKPFGKGDFVLCDNEEGTVESIDLL